MYELASIAMNRWRGKNRFPKRPPAGSDLLLDRTCQKQYLFEDDSVLEFWEVDGNIKLRTFDFREEYS